MANRPRPDEAADALREAERARDRLAAGLTLPPSWHAWIAGAVTVQIGTAALGIALQDLRGLMVMAAGLAVFALIVVVMTVRLRQHTGVRVDGLLHEVLLGAAGRSSAVYVLALGAAVWAAVAGADAYVAVAAIVGGLGYAYGGHRWLRRYREDPATLGRPAPTGWVLVAVGAAVAGLVLLLVGR